MKNIKNFFCTLGQSWTTWAVTVGLIILTALPRLVALNQYLIVDEADRWRWAKDFVYALSRGNLAGTLVGDGYPGIVPVWAESIWIFLEAIRRSFIEGQWIGDPGLYNLFHQWDRTAYLFQQRFPIVLLNTIIALGVMWAVWRIWGKWVALISGLLIALDPFYLSDSRVNRAEALITGLMTLSVIFLILFYQKRQYRYVLISGLFGGLSFLTKIQALIILPVVALVGLFIILNDRYSFSSHAVFPAFRRLLKIGLIWAVAAALIWFILWPAMWVTPWDTLSLIYSYITRKVGAEGVSLFFWGQTFQDADPGVWFYPVVFFMRLTPLALLGLLVAGIRWLVYSVKPLFRGGKPRFLPDDPFAVQGSIILVIFVLTYGLLMTFGSHKQDRYLMPVFLSVDILGAMGLVYLWAWIKTKIEQTIGLAYPKITTIVGASLLALLVVVQLATVIPHHPYYYSYFNPLLGGAHTAPQLLRIGWGEGMDRVGDYLAAKPNSQDLVVSSRFADNILGFDGEIVGLSDDGQWTQADHIVLYIQQVQRRLDPSPGFLDYFQARPPEKVITLGGIDYAWIYPIPFANSANPKVSFIPDKAALLGFSWESQLDPRPKLRLFWKNLGLADNDRLTMRLKNSNMQNPWTVCLPDPNFHSQARRPGEFVESICELNPDILPPDIYSIEFGLTKNDVLDQNEIETFVFPEGRFAVRLTDDRQILDTSELERLDMMVQHAVPPNAHRLNRIYGQQLRLAAYQLEPSQPRPGDALSLKLYWQSLQALSEPLVRARNAGAWGTEYYEAIQETENTIHLIVQVSDSRSIELGRDDKTPPVEAWLPGKVYTTQHVFELPAELDVPLGARAEVTFLNELDVPMPITTMAGESLEPEIERFTISTVSPPFLPPFQGNKVTWQDGIELQGYSIPDTPVKPGDTLPITLLWETNKPISENYMVFVHLLDGSGEIVAQNDSLPRAGAYPTPWWQPGLVVEDVHPLDLPSDLAAGTYRLAVGLYRPEDWGRLSLVDGNDSVVIGTIDVQSP